MKPCINTKTTYSDYHRSPIRLILYFLQDRCFFFNRGCCRSLDSNIQYSSSQTSLVLCLLHSHRPWPHSPFPMSDILRPPFLIVTKLETVFLQYPLGVLHWMASWSQGMHKSFSSFSGFTSFCVQQDLLISVKLFCCSALSCSVVPCHWPSVADSDSGSGCFPLLLLSRLDLFSPLLEKKANKKEQIDNSVDSDSKTHSLRPCLLTLLPFAYSTALHGTLPQVLIFPFAFVKLSPCTRLPFSCFCFLSPVLLTLGR